MRRRNNNSHFIRKLIIEKNIGCAICTYRRRSLSLSPLYFRLHPLKAAICFWTSGSILFHSSDIYVFSFDNLARTFNWHLYSLNLLPEHSSLIFLTYPTLKGSGICFSFNSTSRCKSTPFSKIQLGIKKKEVKKVIDMIP